MEYYQSQRYGEATKLLQQVFGEDPQDLKAISMLAYANNMAGSLTQAEKQYLKLNEADPKNVAVLFSLAGINAKRGNDEKAKGYYKQVLDGDFEQAKIYTKATISFSISPNVSSYYVMLGYLQDSTGAFIPAK